MTFHLSLYILDHRSGLSGSLNRLYGSLIRFVKGTMRADAKKNYSRLLNVAREVVIADGVDSSMREIARRAKVGLATLLRHFPTREALFEALLCKNLDTLALKAGELETSKPPDEALVTWFREGVAFTHSYRGVADLMASAHADPGSPLYASCATVHSVGARLLLRAQAEGTARADMDGEDLFALMSALAWLIGQPAFAPRADHLFHLIASAILANPSSNDVKKGDALN